jgi:hypothetical protein
MAQITRAASASTMRSAGPHSMPTCCNVSQACDAVALRALLAERSGAPRVCGTSPSCRSPVASQGPRGIAPALWPAC